MKSVNTSVLMHTTVAVTLVGPLWPSWAGPLWAPWALMGPGPVDWPIGYERGPRSGMGAYKITYIYIYIYIYIERERERERERLYVHCIFILPFHKQMVCVNIHILINMHIFV